MLRIAAVSALQAETKSIEQPMPVCTSQQLSSVEPPISANVSPIETIAMAWCTVQNALPTSLRITATSLLKKVL